MTKDDFLFLIETQTIREFTYKNEIYRLSYDKSPAGKTIINFGRLYEETKYESVGELLNNAKIQNHFFKDMLDIF